MKKNEFKKNEDLDFGELKGNFYQNKMMNWDFLVPVNYEVNLKSQEERDEIYSKFTSGLLMNSINEINFFLNWTDLIELKSRDKKTFLSSAIRKIEKESRVIPKEIDNQINSFKSDELIDQSFIYQIGKTKLGEVDFDYVEFGEIKYIKGNNVCTPFIKLLGILDGILIRIIISYWIEDDKRKLLELIEIKAAENIVKHIQVPYKSIRRCTIR